MTHKLTVLIWRQQGRRKGLGGDVLVDWFQYNLTCFTPSSLCLRDRGKLGIVSKAASVCNWLLIHHCHQWASPPSLASRTEQLPGTQQPFQLRRCRDMHLFPCRINHTWCLCLSITTQPQFCTLRHTIVFCLPAVWEQTFPPLNPDPKNNHTWLYPG